MTAPKLPENGRGNFPFTLLTQRPLTQVRPAWLLPAHKPLSSAVISPIKVVAHPRLESRPGIGNAIDVPMDAEFFCFAQVQLARLAGVVGAAKKPILDILDIHDGTETAVGSDEHNALPPGDSMRELEAQLSTGRIRARSRTDVNDVPIRQAVCKTGGVVDGGRRVGDWSRKRTTEAHQKSQQSDGEKKLLEMLLDHVKSFLLHSGEA